MKWLFAAPALGVLLLGPICASAGESTNLEAGAKPQQIVNFSLLDYRGKHHELRQTDARVVVLFFTGNGCPIARQSISKIRSLRSKVRQTRSRLLDGRFQLAG
jgi:hypothetical protein